MTTNKPKEVDGFKKASEPEQAKGLEKTIKSEKAEEAKKADEPEKIGGTKNVNDPEEANDLEKANRPDKTIIGESVRELEKVNEHELTGETKKTSPPTSFLTLRTKLDSKSSPKPMSTLHTQSPHHVLSEHTTKYVSVPATSRFSPRPELGPRHFRRIMLN